MIYWTAVLNFIIQHSFSDSFTTCILWNANFDFELQTPSKGPYNQFIHINLNGLIESFEKDVYNFKAKERELKQKGLHFDDFVKKLTVAIEDSHCENFIAFQENIPYFAKSFRNASVFSLWRSQRTKFLFVYRKDIQRNAYFDDILFHDQANILVVEAERQNSTIFDLKTNKFVEFLHKHPEELYLINRFDAVGMALESPFNLYFDKIKNVQGREIILGSFDYRPFVVFDFLKMPQTKDWAATNPLQRIHLDGTEVRILLTFCEKYNCTVEADSTVTSEWGFVFPNTSANGLLGMIVNRKSHMSLGANYLWYRDYVYLDITTFLGRSGITCMVPAAQRLTKWTLPLQPFQFTLWIGIMTCLVLEFVSLVGTRHFESKLSIHHTSWYECCEFGLVTTLKLFISQGSDYVINSFSVRTVLVACYMIDIIITSIYSGGLATILTLPTLDEAADSLERLNKHNLKWTATSNDWIETIRMVKDDPIIVNVVSNFRVYDLDDLRRKAKSENMGFVLERMTFGHFGSEGFFTKEALDRLKLMTDDIYFQYTVGFVPRLWPFLEKFNDFTYAWHSSGLDKFWEWKVTADFLSASDQQQIQNSMKQNFATGPTKLDLKNFAGLIMIWIVGMTFSVITFIGEICYNKICKK